MKPDRIAIRQLKVGDLIRMNTYTSFWTGSESHRSTRFAPGSRHDESSDCLDSDAVFIYLGISAHSGDVFYEFWHGGKLWYTMDPDQTVFLVSKMANHE